MKSETKQSSAKKRNEKDACSSCDKEKSSQRQTQTSLLLMKTKENNRERAFTRCHHPINFEIDRNIDPKPHRTLVSVAKNKEKKRYIQIQRGENKHRKSGEMHIAYGNADPRT